MVMTVKIIKATKTARD